MEARSAIWFLENILIHPDSKYLGIEPGFAVPVDNAISNLLPFPNASIEVGLSKDILPRIDILFDIVRVDGSHKAEHALFDIVNGWNLLNINGVLIVDDYKMSGAFSPRKALDGFLSCLPHRKYEFIWKDYEVAILKKPKSKHIIKIL